jgi:hypothetical protein
MLIKQEEIQDLLFQINKILYAERGIMLKDVEVSKKRRLLLYVNPIGGKGSAITIWNRIKNLFSKKSYKIISFFFRSSKCTN